MLSSALPSAAGANAPKISYKEVSVMAMKTKKIAVKKNTNYLGTLLG